MSGWFKGRDDGPLKATTLRLGPHWFLPGNVSNVVELDSGGLVLWRFRAPVTSGLACHIQQWKPAEVHRPPLVPVADGAVTTSRFGYLHVTDVSYSDGTHTWQDADVFTQLGVAEFDLVATPAPYQGAAPAVRLPVTPAELSRVRHLYAAPGSTDAPDLYVVVDTGSGLTVARLDGAHGYARQSFEVPLEPSAMADVGAVLLGTPLDQATRPPNLYVIRTRNVAAVEVDVFAGESNWQTLGQHSVTPLSTPTHVDLWFLGDLDGDEALDLAGISTAPADADPEHFGIVALKGADGFATKILDATLTGGITEHAPTQAFLGNFSFTGSDLYLFMGASRPPGLIVYEGAGRFTQPLVSNMAVPLKPTSFQAPVLAACVASPTGARDDLLVVTAPSDNETVMLRYLGG